MSREVLGIPGEHAYPVPSLELPEPTEDDVVRIADTEAVRLFVDRARLASHDFELSEGNALQVAQICARLDGIPLAIELAAARIRLLSVREILAKLDHRFRLLTDGSKTALPHHKTLRAAIDWSYEILSPREKQMLRSLSVFSGGWTLDSAVSVCGESLDEFEVLDLLSTLVDKSLVLVEAADERETRYRLLETVREYGLEKLREAEELLGTRERHLGYFLRLAEEADEELRGPDEATWSERLSKERENTQAALQFSAAGGDPTEQLRLSAALAWYWFISGNLSLGRQALDDAIARNADSRGDRLYSKALLRNGILARGQGDLRAARSFYEEALEHQRKLGNKQGSGLPSWQPRDHQHRGGALHRGEAGAGGEPAAEPGAREQARHRDPAWQPGCTRDG